MHIRRLVPSDVAAFQALRLTALREQPAAFGSSFEEECVTPIATIEGRLQPDSERKMFGAFEGGALVGIVGVGREAAVKLRHKGFIRAMYVAKEQRGKGLGRALMEHALAFAATRRIAYGALDLTIERKLHCAKCTDRSQKTVFRDRRSCLDGGCPFSIA